MFFIELIYIKILCIKATKAIKLSLRILANGFFYWVIFQIMAHLSAEGWAMENILARTHTQYYTPLNTITSQVP